MPPLAPHAGTFSVSRRALLLAGLGAAAAGCASAPRSTPSVAPVPPPQPFTLVVTLVAGTDVNPDLRGRPSPIAIRVLELRSTAGFEAADFFSLYERDQAVLGTEMLAREQFIMKPGENQSYTRQANVDTRYLGVVAAYRDLEHSIWRAMASIAMPAQAGRGARPGGPQQRVSINVDRAAVRIEVAAAS